MNHDHRTLEGNSQLAVAESLNGIAGGRTRFVPPDGTDFSNIPLVPTNIPTLTPTFVPRALDPSLAIERADKAIAIVYSETTAANYFDVTAYGQLFMAVQQQAMQAGIPFDLLSENDLTDANLLSQYSSIVFPSFSHVNSANMAAISAALQTASNSGVGLITGGNFMTNDETGAALPGNPYANMANLLGVTSAGFGNTEGIDLVAVNTSHPISDDFAPAERVDSYANTDFQYFTDLTGSGVVLFDQVVSDGTSHDAVIANQTGGRNVHFASDAILGNNNILLHAIDWAVSGDSPSVSLQMTRNTSIFAARNDMDQSQQTIDVIDRNPGIYDELIPILQNWYADYGFVGSYYINVGNNPPAQQTIWSESRPYYEAILALESEIGSHSYTHPFDTNLLTPEQLRFEFLESREIIAQQLGIDVVGAAVPGNPETVATSLEIIQYFDYMTGGYAAEGAGYPGAFGYLRPDVQEAVYFAPNMSFDFSLIEFLGLTPAQASAVWADEYAQITDHGSAPIVVFPWHDYGATNWDFNPDDNVFPGYTTAMYETVIARAAADGAEFVTLGDLAERVDAFNAASLTIEETAGGVDVTVSSTDVGKFALTVDSGQQIANVGNWYAFSNDSVFLPTNGGQFSITYGKAADDVTHISALPMRADLQSVSGNGTDLDFSFEGRGDVGVSLASWGKGSIVATADATAALNGDLLSLTFADVATHAVDLNYQTSLNVSGTAGTDTIITGTGYHVINAGKGNDTTFSDAGADVFGYFSGDGNDLIVDTGSAASGTDVLALKGMSLADAGLFKDDDDLLVRIFGTGEEIRVVDQFDAALPGAGLEIVFFLGSDGATRATLDDLGWMDNQGNSHDYLTA